MEIGGRKRDIYNPYVLNLLYSKVLFFRRLYDAHRATVEWRQSLVKHNCFDRLLVCDTSQLVSQMSRQKFRFDLYYANCEYILIRMLHIFFAQRCNYIAHQPVEIGDVFGCEIKCMTVIETEAQREQFAADTSPVEKAQRRVDLLFRIKEKVEWRVAQVYGGERDYTVRYTKDVVTTMLYLLLVNEFLAQARLQCQSDSLFPVAERSERGLSERMDAEWQADAARDSERAALALLERLSAVLTQQYEDEVCGFQVINTFPEYPSPLPPNTEDPEHFGDYVRHGCVLDTVHQWSHGFRSVQDVATDRLRYVSLLKNNDLYAYATRRFLFENELLLMHSGGDACRLCHYMETHQTLFDFYHQASVNAYNTCHYVVQDSPKLANESLLHLFLAPVIVDIVGSPVDAVLYKALWQLALLYEHTAPLLNQLDLAELTRHIHTHYDRDDGGSDMRIQRELSLAWQRTAESRSLPQFRRAAKITRFHLELALDVDMLLCVTRAVCAQQCEAEKFDLAQQAALLKGAIVDLTILYNFYMDTLALTLQH